MRRTWRRAGAAVVEVGAVASFAWLPPIHDAPSGHIYHLYMVSFELTGTTVPVHQRLWKRLPCVLSSSPQRHCHPVAARKRLGETQ